jgi:two-component system CheB/CheR fusion protein
MNISNMIPKNREGEELTTLNKRIHAEVLEPYRTQRFSKIVEVWLTATSVVNKTGEVYAIATIGREIISENTRRKSMTKE